VALTMWPDMREIVDMIRSQRVGAIRKGAQEYQDRIEKLPLHAAARVNADNAKGR